MSVRDVEIKPDCFYDQTAIRRMLGISSRAIGVACREGKLKSSLQSGKRLFRGSWVIAWLEASQEPATSAETRVRKVVVATDNESMFQAIYIDGRLIYRGSSIYASEIAGLLLPGETIAIDCISVELATDSFPDSLSEL